MFKEVSDETRLSHFRRMIEAHQLDVSGDYEHAKNIGTEFYELITRINERERQLGRAEAFKVAAEVVRLELRWQYEQNIIRNSDTGDSIDRLLELEKVFKYRADAEGNDE